MKRGLRADVATGFDGPRWRSGAAEHLRAVPETFKRWSPAAARLWPRTRARRRAPSTDCSAKPCVKALVTLHTIDSQMCKAAACLRVRLTKGPSVPPAAPARAGERALRR
jgi:hypothetical protein